MFGYYLDLAWRSLARNKLLTALMVAAIGLGIGASMTMLTVLHVLTADPIPGRSGLLFHPQVDPRPLGGYTKGIAPPNELTWTDAMNLLHARMGVHQAAMSGGTVTVVPPRGIMRAFRTTARYTTADFFTMFEVPFADGGGWAASDDVKRAHVAVITRQMADKLYGTPHAVGKTFRLGKYDFRIVGVINSWNPAPHFYDLSTGDYAHAEQVYLPLQTAMGLNEATLGGLNCWGKGSIPRNLSKAEQCAWVQFWVYLDTPAQAAAYRQFLIHYSQEQKQLGRFQRPPNVRLHDVMQWLNYNQVVPGSVQLQTLLALAFLLVCLVNAAALLLVKFLRRSAELAVRRAMGATRRLVFTQLMMEGGLIGLAGGVIGLLLSLFGLWVVRQQPAHYAALAHLDGAMLVTTLVLAVVAALVATLFPAWRACRVPPVRLLKTQ